MGYYTTFELEVIEGDDNNVNHKEEISEHVGYGDCFDGEHKWYTCEEDMKTYSTSCPDVLFKLCGEGEESGDVWEAYFKNGKMQMCKAIITYDDYDEKLLT